MNNWKRLLSILMVTSTVFCSGVADSITVFASEVEAEESTIEDEEPVTDDRVIPRGMTIQGIDVSGMTVSEADAAIADVFSVYDDVRFTLSANGQTVEAKGSDLCICAKNPEVTVKAATYGSYGNFAERFKATKDLEEKKGKSFTLSVSADTAGVISYLEEVAYKVNDDARDNSLIRENGQFVYTEGSTGVVVEVNKSAAEIVGYITNQWNGEDASLELITEVKEPRGTQEELAAITDLIGSYHTDFSSSSAARKNNVGNGASLINGTVLYPGDVMSVLHKITPFTAENGYQLAGSYENGTTVETYGGGICQVSTTLYGAVREAELEIVTRSCHSMVVGYVLPSQDAAISESGSKDFQIKNNKNYPVYIEGYTSGGLIYFNIYGKEEDAPTHKVDYETEVTEVTVQNTTWVADPGQPLGVMHTTTGGHTGYKARLWKIIYEDGEEVSRNVYNNSTYNPSNREVTVGVASDNQALTAAMVAAVATQDVNTIASAIATYAPGVANTTPYVITPQYSVTVNEEETVVNENESAGAAGETTPQ